MIFFYVGEPEITVSNARENQVCMGAIVTFNCAINSSLLLWLLNDNNLYLFPSGDNAAASVGAYAALLSDSGGILRSSLTLTSIPNPLEVTCSNFDLDVYNTLPLTVLTGKSLN